MCIENPKLLTGRGFPGGSGIKNLPANVRDAGSIPGWEDPLEKEMAIQSSFLAWEIPWTEEPGGLQSMESQRVRYDLVSKMITKILIEFSLI